MLDPEDLMRGKKSPVVTLIPSGINPDMNPFNFGKLIQGIVNCLLNFIGKRCYNS